MLQSLGPKIFSQFSTKLRSGVSLTCIVLEAPPARYREARVRAGRWRHCVWQATEVGMTSSMFLENSRLKKKKLEILR